MSQDRAEHVAPDMLARFALGAIEGVDVEQIAAHLAICETCAAVVQATPLDDPLAAVRASLRDTEAWSAANASTPRAVPMPRALREQKDYVIEDLIGFGGMGLVYRARRRTDDRVVALKAIKPDLADDVAWRERFLRESTALRRFRHGNVVECHDVLDLGGTLVIVMEYLEGQTLAEVVKADGKLDPRRACSYVLHAARGLAHVHRNGVVHRDVKLENLQFGADGGLRIVDFGLVRDLREEEHQNLTQTGVFLGTPWGIAPEQVKDPRAVDDRADVYSLGCVLYQLLSGTAPFSSKHLWCAPEAGPGR